MKSIWNEVALQSSELKSTVNTTDGTEDFNQLSDGLTDQNDLIKDKLVEAKELDAPTSHQELQKKLEKALENYSDYLSAAQVLVDADIDDATEQEFNELSNLASDARIACNSFIEEADFTKESISPKVFKLTEVLKPIVEEAQAEREEEERKEKEEQEEKKQAQEKQMTEDTVSGWMNALKDKDYQGMSQYMTSEAYQKIKPEDFEGDYEMVDFVITKTNRINSTEFEVFVTESDEWSDGAKTTTERLFSVVRVSSKWLIDNQRTMY